ncbi:MAG: amidohydrolase family protein [Bacillota bacterium]
MGNAAVLRDALVKVRELLEHCTEGYKIADLLAAKGVRVTVGPLLMTRAKMELNDVSLKNAGILAQAGVKVAIQVDTSSNTRWLPIHTGIAVREGLPEDEAWKATTINPAEILGIADRVGSLEVGKDADIAIFDGHPFDIPSIHSPIASGSSSKVRKFIPGARRPAITPGNRRRRPWPIRGWLPFCSGPRSRFRLGSAR